MNKSTISSSAENDVFTNEEDEVDDEENNDAKDEIENLFIRLNSGGTPLRGEELNYSILKSHIKQGLQGRIEKGCSNFIKPSRFITIAYRLFQHHKKQALRDGLTMRISPKQFQKTISENLQHFETFLERILNEKRYHDKTLLEHARFLIEFNENDNPYGLPYLISSKIAEEAPEVMFMYLFRIMIKEDQFDFNTDVHRKMIGIITLFMWLGKGESSKDHSKLLTNVWPSVKLLKKDFFWSSSTVQRALMDKVLTPFPFYDRTKNKLVQFNTWNNPRPGYDTFEKYDKVTGYGTFVYTIFWNKDLILYAQRSFLSKFFKEKQYYLDDTNVPFDWDHISPSKFIYKKGGIPPIIKDWYNTNGNFRAWPYALNRLDQDDVPAIKLDPLNREDSLTATLKWNAFIERNNHIITSIKDLNKSLLQWSFCTKDWSACEENDLKKNWKRVYRLIVNRNLLICKEWYKQLCIEDLIPNKKQTFEVILDKRRWDFNPRMNGDLKRHFPVDETNVWVSKQMRIHDACLHFYFTFKKDPNKILQSNEIEFGLFEKDESGFISKLKIPETNQAVYDTDKKNCIQGEFTLVSHEEDSYLELMKNFNNWLTEFPNGIAKKLCNEFSETIVTKYKSRIN